MGDVNEQVLARFRYYEGLIRKFGVIDENIAYLNCFMEKTNTYRIVLELEERITISLRETNFTSRIQISFSRKAESYSISVNRLNDRILEIKKDTIERYGMSYKIEAQEVFFLLEKYMSRIDLESMFQDKLIGCLAYAMENEMPDAYINGNNNSKRFNRIVEIVKGLKSHPLYLRFIPYDMNIGEYGFSSLDELRLFLIDSREFIDKKKKINETFGVEMDIILKEERLYLSHK
ncbi:MAG: hypothetical protein GX319_07880 [Clostridiales bacterium]|jgi:DNA-binding Lrp family transcriptional regulator|nr:hypothetical protein [Bacillota bacterium]NLK04312.1 hypothetical protein [Clostridiales bacterium]